MRCVHDMEPGTCDWCAPRPQSQPPLPDGTIVAKTRCRWAKKCPGCGSEIRHGEDIHKLQPTDDPDSAVWVCSGCAAAV